MPDFAHPRTFSGVGGGEQNLNHIHARLAPCGMQGKVFLRRLPCKAPLVGIDCVARRRQDADGFFRVGSCFDLYKRDHAEANRNQVDFMSVDMQIPIRNAVTVPAQIARRDRLAVISDGIFSGSHRQETE